MFRKNTDNVLAMNLGSRRPEGRTPTSEGIVGQYTKKEQPLQFQITNVWTAGDGRRGRKTSAVHSPAVSSSSGGLFTTKSIFSSSSSSPSSAGSPRLPRSPRLFSSQRSRSLSQGGTEGRYTSNAAQGMLWYWFSTRINNLLKNFLLLCSVVNPDSSSS